jgi:diacylglycerol kinase (ATP)
MRVLVVFNPAAGSSAGGAELAEILSKRRGVALRYPRSQAETLACAREAVRDYYDVLVAAGGDGTIHTLVNGLAPHFDAVRLAVLPLGTGNDLCRTLAVPLEADAALGVLDAGRERRIDLIEARTAGRVWHVVNTASGGFGGKMQESLRPEVKSAWGPLAYLRGAASLLTDLQSYLTRITLDDRPPLEEDVLNVIVANGRFAAHGWPVASQASLEDGLLDVVIVKNGDLFDLTEVVAHLVAGDYSDSALVLYRRARRVCVKSNPCMWFSFDGEPETNEPLTFAVLPRALRVLVGPEYQPAPEEE